MAFLVAGLGNPGSRYLHTRHNVGFEVVDLLARNWGVSKFLQKFKSLLAQTTFESHKVVLLKPQTYMNLSGEAVVEAAQFFKIEPETSLLVIVDDMDLPPGKIRIRTSGGTAGHKGVQSIIELLGTESFFRLRIGIGRSLTVPPEQFVLSKITPAELPLFEKTFTKASQAVETILKDGPAAAMNLFNRECDES
ncbi:MAG: aminoacyl-tRNA hydrolase [Deltaproteobacteria bacterium]|nr:aminoacyl-tRNA hydrolase [Deltaproteobacteria bacterium]